MLLSIVVAIMLSVAPVFLKLLPPSIAITGCPLGSNCLPETHTTYKFKSMYAFRDNLAKEWGMKLIIAKNEDAIKQGFGPKDGKFECCTRLKTHALMKCLDENRFDALILAIRRDEHGIRAKERVFSPRDDKFGWDYRNQPVEMWNLYHTETKGHTRVHPILHWREIDVWNYIREKKKNYSGREIY